jgi:hypothetical protein
LGRGAFAAAIAALFASCTAYFSKNFLSATKAVSCAGLDTFCFKKETKSAISAESGPTHQL